MAKTKAFSFTDNPGMVFVLSYVVLFGVNAVVLLLANAFFPENVVLGTYALSPRWSVFLSMGTLALLDTFAIPFARELERMKGRPLTTQEWMVKYFFLNFAGLWLITRFSEQFGVGVTSWGVVGLLAIVLDFVQGAAMMRLETIRKMYSA